MLGFLRSSPYAVAVLVAVLTAALAWAYARTLAKEGEDTRKVFNKTLAAGLIAGLLLTWMVHKREHVSTEPFSE